MGRKLESMQYKITLKSFVFVIVMFCLHSEVHSSKEVMKGLSEHFGKALEVCMKELDLPETVIQEFANFWKEGYQLTNRYSGCALMCMASKLDLLDQEYNIHHQNTHEFIRNHGADDAQAKQLADLIHKCSETSPKNLDPCITALSVTQCFKDKIHDLNWAPSADIIMAEVLSET